MRYGSLECLLLMLAMLPLAAAAPASAPSHIFEGRDLFGLQWVTEPQIRPDGGAIAYVRMGYDIMNDRSRAAIWLVDINSGAQVPLTSGPGTLSALAWSPDGKRLAYVSNEPIAANSSETRAELFVRWIASGET